MLKQKDLLWPYSKAAAIAAIPIIWVLFAIVFSLTKKYSNWPDAESRTVIIYITVLISLIPLALLLLDYFRRHGAVIDVKGVKIDFSRVDLSKPEVRRESFGIPENIGISGPIQTDTSPMDIIETLKEARNNEIICVDLREGKAWWVTRLLALSAGAVRAGSPNAFVFVGKRKNVEHKFLGWGKPADILQAILNDKEEYKSRYQRAMRIARQVVMYGFNELVPEDTVLHNDVIRYTNNQDFVNLGEEVSEQILMDQLALSFADSAGSLEETPDRLTYGRLNDLFGHCLYEDSIEVEWPNEEKTKAFLNSNAPYVALVRDGKFESMIKREDGERLIIWELFLQSQPGKNLE